jgi:mannose-6-phosphate isomerase-like protein (cupin superfamily)
MDHEHDHEYMHEHGIPHSHDGHDHHGHDAAHPHMGGADHEHSHDGSHSHVHTHEHSQATFVASGKFELTIGNEKRVLSAGDGYYVKPDEPHGCLCIEAGVLIDTFSPVRADFLSV